MRQPWGGKRPMSAKVKKSDYVPSGARARLSPGYAVRVIRELQEMTLTELAQATGIAQSTLSSIENGRTTLGADRAERLAPALKVHPAVLLWPNWGAEAEWRRAVSLMSFFENLDVVVALAVVVFAGEYFEAPSRWAATRRPTASTSRHRRMFTVTDGSGLPPGPKMPRRTVINMVSQKKGPPGGKCSQKKPNRPTRSATARKKGRARAVRTSREDSCAIGPVFDASGVAIGSEDGSTFEGVTCAGIGSTIVADDFEHYVRLTDTPPRGLVLEVGIVRWPMPWHPEVKWQRYWVWSARPTEREIEKAKTALAEDPRFFRNCALCGVRNNAGHMHDDRVCQSCATKHFGVAY